MQLDYVFLQIRWQQWDQKDTFDSSGDNVKHRCGACEASESSLAISKGHG